MQIYIRHIIVVHSLNEEPARLHSLSRQFASITSKLRNRTHGCQTTSDTLQPDFQNFTAKSARKVLINGLSTAEYQIGIL